MADGFNLKVHYVKEAPIEECLEFSITAVPDQENGTLHARCSPIGMIRMGLWLANQGEAALQIVAQQLGKGDEGDPTKAKDGGPAENGERRHFEDLLGDVEVDL